MWVDRAGKLLSVIGDRDSFGDVELSPDGRSAAVSIQGRSASPTPGSPAVNRDVWLIDLARGVRSRFTYDNADDGWPVWSPDALSIAFASTRSRQDPNNVFLKRSNGASPEQILLEAEGMQVPLSWSPNGEQILYFEAVPSRLGQGRGESGTASLWVQPLTGDRRPYEFLRVPSIAPSARFSPDGRWVVYVSAESGRSEVYVTPFPGPGGRIRISTSGGVQPRWRRDGKEIFYLSGTAPSAEPPGRGGGSQALMAVAVNMKGDVLDASSPQRLFGIRPGGPRSSYDIAADSKRFLVNMASEPSALASTTPITVVVNWTAGLSRQRE